MKYVLLFFISFSPNISIKTVNLLGPVAKLGCNGSEKCHRLRCFPDLGGYKVTFGKCTRHPYYDQPAWQKTEKPTAQDFLMHVSSAYTCLNDVLKHAYLLLGSDQLGMCAFSIVEVSFI